MTVTELHVLVNQATAWPLQQVLVQIEGKPETYQIVQATGQEGNDSTFLIVLGVRP